MKKQVLSSSELSSYDYCALSWHLQRLKTPVPEEAAELENARLEGGAASHDAHAHAARRMALKETLSKYALVAAILAGALYLLRGMLL